MNAQLVGFAILASLIIGGSMGVVTSKNVAHAALYLLLSLLGVAGIFILLLAEFLALVQVLIYGGAVIIVLLFALMLTRQDELSQAVKPPKTILPLFAAAGMFFVFAFVMLTQPLVTFAIQGSGITSLGQELFQQWAIPFEIASVLLLVALIGAIILARSTDQE